VAERWTGGRETYSLDWSPRGDVLVTAGLGGKIILWSARDLTALKELEAPEWVIRVRFSPDGARLFSAGGTVLPSPDRKVTIWGLAP
jgi:WD40 repeat protein